ncbi:hypothetical protein [Natronosalvus rutilus]|uniref:Uncharacterized protein n=1 Tax=Natronosalvus rutilus TaxID=2953753 RepID=A0A9E7NAG4_9EURY|nr:hypothetical protein [Natronosalvus rutilus]UTF53255.1 hypothetical protein NGM29_16000 [Natronosalvus rutilus]
MARKIASGEIGEESFDAVPTGRRIAVMKLVPAVVLGVLIGGLVALSLSNIGGAAAGFVVATLLSAYYLYRKPLPSAVFGTGLYLTAGLLVLAPILFYVPTILAPDGSSGAEEAGTFIGSILGLFLWGFVFFLIALVVFTLGYFSNRRAKKKLSARASASRGSYDP